jgi:hypothetical protein
MSLLIALPIKTTPNYAERFKACEETWLKDSPVDYRGFSDAELGLTEINQHDNANDPIRTHRTQRMVKYAYENGYDHIFRVDTDAYVWINRLLASGFEKHDYMGWCVDTGQGSFTGDPHSFCNTTAHGGIGFTLSRRAMKVIIDAPICRYGDGKYWGDLWAGDQLWKKGIHCKRDTRFLDGSGHATHHGNIAVHELPDDHPYISVHPALPVENIYAIHERFKNLPAETVAPKYQLWHFPDANTPKYEKDGITQDWFKQSHY